MRCRIQTRFACGSMVLFDHMFIVFALYERKNDKREKGSTAAPERRRGAAEGSERQLRKF